MKRRPTDEPPSRNVAPSAPGFVALSRFVVANGMTDAVKAAFVHRPHEVDDVTGFLRMDVLSPSEAPDEIWLLTYWSDEESFRAWHGGPSYRHAHSGIPRGLKLLPKETRLTFFRYVAS